MSSIGLKQGCMICDKKEAVCSITDKQMSITIDYCKECAVPMKGIGYKAEPLAKKPGPTKHISNVLRRRI